MIWLVMILMAWFVIAFAASILVGLSIRLADEQEIGREEAHGDEAARVGQP